MLSAIFDTVVGDAKGLRRCSRLRAERKTGLYAPDGEKTRLVRDDRGWLRAGGLTHLSESNTVRGLSRGKEQLEMRGPTGVIGLIVTIIVIYLILRFLGLI